MGNLRLHLGLITALLFLLPIFNLQAAFSESFEITNVKICLKVDRNRNPIHVTNKLPGGTQNVYAWFSWKNAPKSQTITARWHYVSEDIHILDSPVTLTRHSDQGVLILRMPEDKPLPSGMYRMDIEADGKVLNSTSFTVRPDRNR
ncbi:MAG: hypothetical protein HY583_01930 [Candidatus Omnitrophica bacterium]|nr:hypothetical protein [Candidatus Omnitrophota bacterium]